VGLVNYKLHIILKLINELWLIAVRNNKNNNNIKFVDIRTNNMFNGDE
jgi:hypothetical protein